MEIEPQTEAVKDRYLAWKKNAVHLYKILNTVTLPWPSLTVQWQSVAGKGSDDQIREQKLLLGTRTAGQAAECVRIGSFTIPKLQATDTSYFDPDQGIVGGYDPQSRRNSEFKIYQRIDHEGAVTKARYMPSNQNILATMSSVGKVSVFDVTHYPLQPCGVIKASIDLEGHLTEGYGLAWSPLLEGTLATGANDAQLMLWDIQKYSSATGKLSPLQTLKYHSGAVSDVAWHKSQAQIVGSVSDDRQFILSDWRSPAIASKADTKDHVPCSLEFNPANIHLAAVGSEDGTVQLWDMRSPMMPLAEVKEHTDACIAVRWNLTSPTVLATASSDSRAIVWDSVLIAGAGASANTASSGSDAILFIHEGHTAAINDLDWNPHIPNMLATCADDNSLHFWEPDASLYSLL